MTVVDDSSSPPDQLEEDLLDKQVAERTVVDENTRKQVCTIITL